MSETGLTLDGRAWLSQTFGVSLGGGGGGGGLEGWRSARTAALGQLVALETAFRGMDEPEVNEAIILLKAIQANLTEAPETAQQVDELRKYLETSDIIEEAEEPNGFGLTINLREPLLAALAQVRPAKGA